MGGEEIVRVWGFVDGSEIVFSKGAHGNWETAVPPDLSDGQYAAEILAENGFGERAIWSGILYMHNGKACLHLNDMKYTFWLEPMAVNIFFEGACCHH